MSSSPKRDGYDNYISWPIKRSIVAFNVNKKNSN